MTASLYSSPISGWILKTINEDVKKNGFVQAIQNVLKKTHSQLIIQNKTKEIENILKNDTVLVISNHPAETDVLVLLASIPQRSDFYLIAQHSIMKILPNIDKHIIPVFIGHKQNKNIKENWSLFMLKLFHHSKDYSPKEAHQKNIKSINMAAQKIDNHALVVIFPEGGGELGKFFYGVGHLLKNIKNINQVKIIMVNIRGTSKWDYLRLIPFFSKIMPKFEINFTKPLVASSFLAKDAKIITQKLQDKYKKLF